MFHEVVRNDQLISVSTPRICILIIFASPPYNSIQGQCACIHEKAKDISSVLLYSQNYRPIQNPKKKLPNEVWEQMGQMRKWEKNRANIRQ